MTISLENKILKAVIKSGNCDRIKVDQIPNKNQQHTRQKPTNQT